MQESRIAATKRLQAAGLWEEASQYRDKVRQESRAGGATRAEANERAWEAMAEKYPPNPDPQEPADCHSEAEPAEAEVYPAEVGAGADFTADVSWVYGNFQRVVITSPGKPARCDFSRATTPPPSSGAVGLMHWAADNRTAFFKDLVPKIVKTDDADDEDMIRRERKSIAEIGRILDDMNQEFQREMVENAPETVRKAVRSSLTDWERRYGVALPDEALAALDAHVMDLGTRLVEAAGGLAQA